MKNIKNIIYLVVLYGFISCVLPAHAGSFDDFFTAIKRDDGHTIAALVSRGFDVNTRNPAGEHGLTLAIRDESFKAVAALLQVPTVNIEARSQQDESPLMLAALKGNMELVEQLIAKDADVNKPGWAPLHYAATNGHIPIMSLLLDKHAYIDASSPNGSTPLMLAAKYGTPTAVKLLLEAGADPLLKNDQGLTAKDFALQDNRKDSAELITAFVRALQPRGAW